MTPDFCKKCRHLNGTGSCYQYKKCAAWRKWFRKEWTDIQRRAKSIKEQENTEKSVKNTAIQEIAARLKEKANDNFINKGVARVDVREITEIENEMLGEAE